MRARQCKSLSFTPQFRWTQSSLPTVTGDESTGHGLCPSGDHTPPIMSLVQVSAQTAWGHLHCLNWPLTQSAEVRVWLRHKNRGIILKPLCGLNICVPYPTAQSQGFTPLPLPAFPH